MALFRWIRLFQDAIQFARVDNRVLEQSKEAPKQRSYHRKIVAVSALSAIAVGIVGTIELWQEQAADDADRRMLYLSPLIFGAVGMFFGLALACAVAPRAFLSGPIGAKWMALIGAKSIASARIICGVLALVLGCGVAFLALAHTLQAHGILPPPQHQLR